MPEDFHGAKVALFVGDKLLVVQRDDLDTIPWPNHWDFPGGGREGQETPQQTVIRETKEEVGLTITPPDFLWDASYMRAPGSVACVWFFVAKLPKDFVDHVRLGDEGQAWALMTPSEYMMHPLRIPHFADRLVDYLSTL